jgi:hypothetical protein
VLNLGIIFQLWNNLSTVRNILGEKLFHCFWQLDNAYWYAWYREGRA